MLSNDVHGVMTVRQADLDSSLEIATALGILIIEPEDSFFQTRLAKK
jgi:hypothetical protein